MKNPGCTIIGTVVAKPEKRDELMRVSKEVYRQLNAS